MSKNNIKFDIDVEATNKKNWEKERPQFLLEVITDVDGKIEEYTIIESFEGGNYGKSLKECIGDHINEEDLENVCNEPDTQYHVYGRIDYYQSGYYEVEWDYDVIIIQCIPVMREFSKFCKEECDYEEQEHKKLKDTKIDTIETNGDNYGGFNLNPNMTYNDLMNIVKTVSLYDIRLAHRVLSGSYFMKEILGDKYDEKIRELEDKRTQFKNYIRYNSRLYVSFSEKGYRVSKTKGEKYPIDITYEQIENITDEYLEKYSIEDLFELFYSTPAILKAFDRCNTTSNK